MLFFLQKDAEGISFGVQWIVTWQFVPQDQRSAHAHGIVNELVELYEGKNRFGSATRSSSQAWSTFSNTHAARQDPKHILSLKCLRICSDNLTKYLLANYRNMHPDN